MRGIRRGLALCIFFWLPVAGCASDQGDTGTAVSCVPGQQISCGCPGSGQGSQVCNADGKSYGPCAGCASGSGGLTGTGGWPGTGGSAGSGGAAGASGGSGGVATGGSAGAGGSTLYEQADCLASSSNGSEICDDEAVSVPAPGTPLVLVCLSDNGGTIYVSNNTGPVMSDGIARCQGWETNGQNAWDYLDYIAKMTCDSVQKELDVDLSGYVGQTVWVGTHDDPAGGGHNTPTCLAWKK
jgi:hypothetical protein